MAVSLALSACSEPANPNFGLEVRYVSGRARVGTDIDEPLCEGNLAFVDAHAVAIEGLLGVELDEKVRIDVYAGIPVPGCSRGATGCYDFGSGLVSGMWEAVPHELVHAIGSELGRPDSFWEEGLAEALSGRMMTRGQDVHASMEEFAAGGSDYTTAGHFVRWLIEWRGPAALASFYENGNFEAEYGIVLDEAIAIYEAQASWAYPSLEPCSEPRLETASDRLDATLHLGCAEPDALRGYLTTFHYDRVSTVRTFELGRGGPYELFVDGGYAVEIIGCRTESVADEPATKMRGAVYDETKRFPPPIFWESNREHILELGPGTYRLVVISSPGSDEENVRISLAPQD